MTNGFYDMSSINTTKKLIKFYKRAIELSYNVMIHTLPGYAREMDKSNSIENILKLVSPTTHNVCIDRFIYNMGVSCGDDGEVGFSTTFGESKFLFCFMSRDNLWKLVSEFNLKLKE